MEPLRIAPRVGRGGRRLFFGCLLLVIGPLCDAAEAVAGKLLILAVAINGEPPTEPLAVFRTTEGQFYLSDNALDKLHLRRPEEATAQIDHESFFALSVLGASQVRLEDATQVLQIAMPPSAFRDTIYNQHPNDVRTLDNPAFGGFLNYDVFYANDVQSSLSGLVEAGAFFGGGTLTSRYVGHDLTGERALYRLDTQYQRDFPAEAATLVIGDSVSGAATWSRAVNFAGVQWHTNFGTRPDLQPIPLPSIAGSAAVPSTVDLYVDNVLRGRQTVDSGPFTLNNIPTLSGQGNLTLVVHDALGRQQVFVQNYITSPALLREGTVFESFEIGALHNDFGLQTAGYGAGFTSATVRYGLTNSQTLEVHAEGSSTLAAGGLGVATAFPQIGVFSAGGALSTARAAGQGVLGYAEFDHETSAYGVSLRSQLASAGFQQLGLVEGEGEPRASAQAQLSTAISARSTFLIGYTQQINRRLAGFRSVNLGVNLALERYGSVFAGVVQSFAPAHTISANLIWTIPVGDLAYLQLATNAQNHASQTTIEVDQAPPAELGWGYRLRQAFGMPAGTDASVTYRAETGEYTLSASNVAGQTSTLLEARGGVAALGGHLLLTKWLDQSFALVTVPTDIPIDIYSNNVKIGHTNADGVGLVPNLVAYEKNHVMLDPTGIPLTLTLDLSVHDVTPTTRTGVVVRFASHVDAGATLQLVRPDGSPLPNGTRVDVPEQGLSARVALHGEVFFQNIALPARLQIVGESEPCSIRVPAPESNEAFPKLGPFSCANE